MALLRVLMFFVRLFVPAWRIGLSGWAFKVSPGKLLTDTFLDFESPRLLMLFNTESTIMMTFLLYSIFIIISMLDHREVIINNIIYPLLKPIDMVINGFINTGITIEVLTSWLDKKIIITSFSMIWRSSSEMQFFNKLKQKALSGLSSPIFSIWLYLAPIICSSILKSLLSNVEII